jgi:hypothetical protein
MRRTGARGGGDQRLFELRNLCIMHGAHISLSVKIIRPARFHNNKISTTQVQN